MKIISSFIDDLSLQEDEYHTITFESSYVQSQFRDLLRTYFNRQTQSDCHYLSILNDDGTEIQSKDFYFISFDCNVINLHEEKDTTQSLQNVLYYHLENNPDLINEYLKFNEYMAEFTNCIEIVNDKLKVDFRPSEKTIKQFIKSLNISIEYNDGDFVPNHIMRQFLIQSLLKMNITEKEVFLIVSFPETDIGSDDYKSFIEILKQLHVTTLIITTQSEFLTASSEENMFLVDKHGKMYDIISLKQQLLALEVIDVSSSSIISKTLAIRDFKKDYFLLDQTMKLFLQSNKF